MKTKIHKIILEVGGKNLEFTPDEAKELKTILSDLFGGEKVTYVDRWHGNWPWYNYPTMYLSGTTTGALYSGQAWQGTLSGGTATFQAQSALNAA